MKLPKKFKFIAHGVCYTATYNTRTLKYDIENPRGRLIKTWRRDEFQKYFSQHPSWRITEVIEEFQTRPAVKPDTLFNINDL